MTHNRSKGFVAVGGVVKPHGIRGEFCIKSYADSPSLFSRVGALFLQDGSKSPQPFTVRSWREHKGLILMKLQGVDDRDRAEEIRGWTVLVHEDDLPDLEEGEHYLYQMMGCRVVLEDGSAVGVLETFRDRRAGYVGHCHRRGQGSIAARRAEFVLDVDLDSEVITIDPPEGLLDIYLNPEPPKKKKKRKRPSGRQKAEGK